MALSLNAEQKSLLKIFKIEEKYIIPGTSFSLLENYLSNYK